MSASDLAHMAKNLNSDLFSFGCRHMAQCQRCKRSKIGRCGLMRAVGRLDDELYAEMRRAKPKTKR